MIKVIGFDLDDTLWAVRPIIIRAEQQLDAWLKAEVPDMIHDVTSMRGLREEVVSQRPELAHQVTALRRTIIETAMVQSGIDARRARQLATDAMETFLHARNQIEFFDGALPAIRTLAQDYTLGALTNGNADITRLGLATYFSFAFSAEDVGAPKPEPDLFHKALSHTSARPHEMIYVGDDPQLDIDTANELGLRTVWVNSGNKPPGRTIADETIEHLEDLPAAIRSINK
jgi:HAD superfamily hydrolase (TIGR01549 family)